MKINGFSVPNGPFIQSNDTKEVYDATGARIYVDDEFYRVGLQFWIEDDPQPQLQLAKVKKTAVPRLLEQFDFRYMYNTQTPIFEKKYNEKREE